MTWEWGVIGVDLIIFIIASEIYKLVKNHIDPLPVYDISPEDKAMEKALLNNEFNFITPTITLDGVPDLDDSKSMQEICEEQLKASFVRQVSYSSIV